MTRQLPISVAGPSVPESTRQPAQISTPQLIGRSRTPITDILSALGRTTGIVVQAQADAARVDQRSQQEQFERQVEEVEKAETAFYDAKAAGDTNAQELLYRRMLDLSKRGAEDGSLSSGHRTSFQQRLQGYYSDEIQYADKLATIERRHQEAKLEMMGEAVESSVISTLGSRDRSMQFVHLGHRGHELREPLSDVILGEYLANAQTIYGMSAEEAEEWVSTPVVQERFTHTVNKMVAQINALYDSEEVDRLKSNKQARQFDIARNAAVHPHDRVNALVDDGVKPETAVEMVSDNYANELGQETPFTQEQYQTIQNLAEDQKINLSDSRKRTIAAEVAENTIAFYLGDITDADVVSGEAMSKANSVLSRYGMSVAFDDNDNPKIVGQKNRFDENFADRFEVFLTSIKAPESLIFTDPTQANKLFSATNTFSLMNAISDPRNPRSRVNFNSLLRGMNEAGDGFLDQGVSGQNRTLRNLIQDALHDWKAADYETGTQEHKRFARLMGNTMAAYLNHSDILPSSLSSSLADTFTNGGDAGALWAMSVINATGNRVREQMRLDGVDADIMYALNTELGYALGYQPVRAELPQDSRSDRITALRTEYNELQDLRQSLDSDPRKAQRITEAIKGTFEDAVLSPDAYETLGGYLTVLRVQRPGEKPERLVKEAVALAEADGLYQYIQYGTRISTANFSRGLFTLKPTDLEHIRDGFEGIGQDARHFKRDLFTSPILATKTLMEDFGRYDIPDQKLKSYIEILTGFDTHNQVTISQRESQTYSGGAILEFTYFDPKGKATNREHVAVDQETIELWLGNMILNRQTLREWSRRN